jgi:hypothetical protein
MTIEARMDAALEQWGDRYPRLMLVFYLACLGGIFGLLGGLVFTAAYLPQNERLALSGLWALGGAILGGALALLLVSSVVRFLVGLFLLVGFVRWAWDWWA